MGSRLSVGEWQPRSDRRWVRLYVRNSFEGATGSLQGFLHVWMAFHGWYVQYGKAGRAELSGVENDCSREPRIKQSVSTHNAPSIHPSILTSSF